MHMFFKIYEKQFNIAKWFQNKWCKKTHTYVSTSKVQSWIRILLIKLGRIIKKHHQLTDRSNIRELRGGVWGNLLVHLRWEGVKWWEMQVLQWCTYAAGKNGGSVQARWFGNHESSILPQLMLCFIYLLFYLVSPCL